MPTVAEDHGFLVLSQPSQQGCIWELGIDGLLPSISILTSAGLLVKNPTGTGGMWYSTNPCMRAYIVDIETSLKCAISWSSKSIWAGY